MSDDQNFVFTSSKSQVVTIEYWNNLVWTFNMQIVCSKCSSQFHLGINLVTEQHSIFGTRNQRKHYSTPRWSQTTKHTTRGNFNALSSHVINLHWCCQSSTKRAQSSTQLDAVVVVFKAHSMFNYYYFCRNPATAGEWREGSPSSLLRKKNMKKQI